jgi:hypothetical protein
MLHQTRESTEARKDERHKSLTQASVAQQDGILFFAAFAAFAFF